MGIWWEKHNFRTLFLVVQNSAKRLALGLVNFIPAVAYHFCVALPAAFTQPGAPVF